MEILTSDYKKYKCQCQKDIISAKDLKKHLNIPANHVIVKDKEKKQLKKVEKSLLISCKILKLGIEKSSRYFLSLKQFLFQYNFKTDQYLQINIKTNKNTNLKDFRNQLSTSNKNSQSIFHNKIMSILNKPLLKEITMTKYLKQKYKSHINFFLFIDKLLLISGGIDSKLRLWNPQTLQQTACLSYHKSTISSLEIDSSSNFLLSGSWDSSICLWNIKKKKLITVFKGHEHYVNSLKFFNNSKIFVSGSNDETVRIWNTFNPSLLYIINLKSSVKFVSFKYEKFIFVCEDGSIENFEVKSSNPLKKVKYKSDIKCSYLGEKSDVLMTGHEDGLVQFINSKTFKLLSNSNAHHGYVDSIDFCEKSLKFATTSIDLSIKIWCSKFLRVIKSFRLAEVAICAIISENNIYFGGINSHIELKNINSFKTLTTTKLSKIYQSSFCVSLKFDFVVYSFNMLYLFCLKLLKDIKSIQFFSRIMSVCTVNSFIFCGTMSGNIFLISFKDFQIKMRYFFENSGIPFISVSKDLKFMCFSTENKSKMIELKSSRRLLSLNNKIQSGKFSSNVFVFFDSNWEVYVFDRFEKLLKITSYYGVQFYFFKFCNFLMFKEFDSKYHLVDLRNSSTRKSYDSLKELCLKENKRELRMSCESLILLSFHYTHYLN